MLRVLVAVNFLQRGAHTKKEENFQRKKRPEVANVSKKLLRGGKGKQIRGWGILQREKRGLGVGLKKPYPDVLPLAQRGPKEKGGEEDHER